MPELYLEALYEMAALQGEMQAANLIKR